MEVVLTLKAFLIGFTVSMPLGAIGLLCIQRTLTKGQKSGFFSGLGVASADAVFSLIAGLGISFIINFIEKQQMYFKIVGGMIIIILGVTIFYSNPVRQLRLQRLNRNRLYEDYLSVFFLAISNPLTTLSFIALFAAFNIATSEEVTFLGITFIIAGVFSGSATWWFLLTSIISVLRHRFRLKHLWWMNKIAGVVISTFGLAVILSAWLLKPFPL